MQAFDIQQSLKDNRFRISTFGLGSNLHDPVKQIRQAMQHLKEAFGCCRWKQSSLYLTPPLQKNQGGFYINAVCQVYTDLQLLNIFKILQSIESQMGRVREGLHRYAPRIIDLDFLFCEDIIHTQTCLTIPHPEVFKRSFTLIPIYEIDPNPLLPHSTSEFNKALFKATFHPITRLASDAMSENDIDPQWSTKNVRSRLQKLT